MKHTTEHKKSSVLDPKKLKRDSKLAPLSILLHNSFSYKKILEIKRRENVPVIVTFPARSEEEYSSLIQKLKIINPLINELIDEVWIAFCGDASRKISSLKTYPGVNVFLLKELLSKSSPINFGKGSVMRSFLYWIVTHKKYSKPNTIIQFIDADLKKEYFTPRWIIDPVGAILWFKEIEVAKIVYERPYGGRLDAFVRSLLNVFDHPSLNFLKKLIYILSGEIAGTLKFWLGVPFTEGYGIEIKILSALAFNKINFQNEENDLEHVVQVFMGLMDHRHTPLKTTPLYKGLDCMGKDVFYTFLSTMYEEGFIKLKNGICFSNSFEITEVLYNKRNKKLCGPIRIKFKAIEKVHPPLKFVKEIKKICPWCSY